MSAGVTQPYQHFKLWLADYLPVDRDALHVGIGAMIVIAAFFLVSNHRLAVSAAVAGSLIVGLAMETLDLRDALVAFEPLRWDLGFADLLRTMTAPICVVWWYWLARRNMKDP